MSQMMKTMQDPEYRTKVEAALKGMRDDPELKPMLDELETAGPMAMMKCVQACCVLGRGRWREAGARREGRGRSASALSGRAAVACAAHFPHRYWNDPEVLSKLGKAMGSALDMPAGLEDREVDEEGEEEAVEENLHAAASAGARTRTRCGSSGRVGKVVGARPRQHRGSCTAGGVGVVARQTRALACCWRSPQVTWSCSRS